MAKLAILTSKDENREFSFKSNFDSLVKSALSYYLATLQHIPHIHSALYGNSTSLED